MEAAAEVGRPLAETRPRMRARLKATRLPRCGQRQRSFKTPGSPLTVIAPPPKHAAAARDARPTGERGLAEAGA